MRPNNLLPANDSLLIEKINKFIDVLCASDIDFDPEQEPSEFLSWRSTKTGIFLSIEDLPSLFQSHVDGGRLWELLRLFIDGLGYIAEGESFAIVHIFPKSSRANYRY